MPTKPELPPPSPRPAGAATALAGIRVLDFTHFIAGPVATMFLGDMGADVIKIEKVGRGDDFRGFGPQRAGMGPPFVWCNRNKKSAALDLTKPEGQQIARVLAATADVVAENFSAGVMTASAWATRHWRRTIPAWSIAPSRPMGVPGPMPGGWASIRLRRRKAAL